MRTSGRCGRSGHGFTLIELLIAITIVGILVAIAYPSYTQMVLKSRRADAKAALLDIAQRQERYMSTANVYATTPTQLGYSGTFPMPIRSGGTAHYQLEMTLTPAVSPTAFAATATPLGAQTADRCGAFKLRHTGVQEVTGTLPATDCW